MLAVNNETPIKNVSREAGKNLVRYAQEHDGITANLSADGRTLSVECDAVLVGGTVIRDRSTIPATMTALRNYLGY